jgi:hypothetical protein
MFKNIVQKNYNQTIQQFLYNEGSSIILPDLLLKKNFCLKNDITLVNLSKNEEIKKIFLKKRLK